MIPFALPRISAALLALLIAVGLVGCATHAPLGEYRPFEYQTCLTKPREGKIAVTFAADSVSKPDIEWQLFATGQTSGWRSVNAHGAPCFLSKPEQSYGLEFRWTPEGKNLVSPRERPIESRMLRILEKQCLTVPVVFK